MRCVFVAPLAEFLELQAALDRLLILARKIIHAVALRTLDFDEIVL